MHVSHGIEEMSLETLCLLASMYKGQGKCDLIWLPPPSPSIPSPINKCWTLSTPETLFFKEEVICVVRMDGSDLPDDGPHIEGGKPRYQIGEDVQVNCTSSRARPAAKLSWQINGELVTFNITFSLLTSHLLALFCLSS